jgi:Flp pilus assembly protein TadD
LQSQIEAKQVELLRLQQSIHIENARQAGNARLENSPMARQPAKALSAYDLDRQGRQYYRERNYDLAIASFRQAVKKKPGDAVLLNNLGYALYRAGHNEEAVDWLKKTLAADPGRKEAYGNLGDAYFKLGKTAEARAHYESYLRLYPHSPLAAQVRLTLDKLSIVERSN